MMGLIVLFWFVAEGVALRYFVDIFTNISYVNLTSNLADIVHWGHELHVRCMGCNR